MTRQLVGDFPLMNLMISFFFKSGQAEGGCEFLHKSFREYLAAEAIIETLKEYGRSLENAPAERDHVEYWRDFRADDRRHWLSRKLGEMLSAQWPSREIRRHLIRLIKWEVKRATELSPDRKRSSLEDLATNPITTVQWEIVRDGLSDLWDWWGEGVHLRPRPYYQKKMWSIEEPYADGLARNAMRRWNSNIASAPRPPRVVTIDAHLGAALFGLCSDVHFVLAETMGWDQILKDRGTLEAWSHFEIGPRRYQATAVIDGKRIVQFAPSGTDGKFFRNYVSRINGAGSNASYEFPRGENLGGQYLKKVDLSRINFGNAFMKGCNCSDAVLFGTDLSRATARYMNLNDANCFRAAFMQTNFDGANLQDANFYLADLRRAMLTTAVGLTKEQVRMAAAGTIDDPLPSGLIAPRNWKRSRTQAIEAVLEPLPTRD